MIKNIIFDFGDVFINLDKEIVFKEMIRFGGVGLTDELKILNETYEIGGISSKEFIKRLQNAYPKASSKEIVEVWNSMLLDFPEYRLEFLEQLAKEQKYRLFLLSNTNDLHISHIDHTLGHVAGHMGMDRFRRFKKCFEKFYLSHEINLRKPDPSVFEFVLDQNGLKCEETFFVDDTKENTDAASKLGIKTWHLNVGQEDIIHLKSRL